MDKPRCAHKVPIFFPLLALMGEHGISGGRVVRGGLGGDDIRQNPGEIFVLVDAKNVTKEAAVVRGILAP